VATSLGLLHYLERRTAAAIASFAAVLELDPGFTLARHLQGVALLETATPADAVPVLEAVCAAGRSTESLAALAAAYATVDRRADALRLLSELETMAGTRYVSPVLLAQVHLALRHPEKALDQLERACERRASELAWLAVRPTWAPLRGAARFQDLLRRVRLA
jgi:predicted Zn-dependent protease